MDDMMEKRVLKEEKVEIQISFIDFPIIARKDER